MYINSFCFCNKPVDRTHAYFTSGLSDIVDEGYLNVISEFKAFLENLDLHASPAPDNSLNETS